MIYIYSHLYFSFINLFIVFYFPTVNIIFIENWGRGKVWSLRLPVTQEVAGSNPVVPAKGQIAQSVEHLSEKQGVGSSILPLATK